MNTSRAIRIAAVAALVLPAVAAFGQAGYYSTRATTVSRQTVIGQSANVLSAPGASIYVCNTTLASPTVCTSLASIYADAAMAQPISQPFQADLQGNFSFYANVGNYAITITPTSGLPTVVYPVTIGSGGSSVGPATSTSLGTVTLANGQTSTKLSKVATTGNYLDLLNLPTIPTLVSQLTNDAGYINASQSPVQTVNHVAPVLGDIELALNAGTVTRVNGYQPDSNGYVVIPAATTSASGVLPQLSGVATQYLNGTGAWTVPPGGSGGGSSVGATNTPQVSNGAGGFIADPLLTINPSGSTSGARQLNLTGQGQYDWTRSTDGTGSQSKLYANYSTAPTWNYGSYTNPSGTTVFATTAFHTIDTLMACYGSAICQVRANTVAHMNMGDHSFEYTYDNYMPGTALAGSDEGYGGMRFGSFPSKTFYNTLTTNPISNDPLAAQTNVPGGPYLRWNYASSGKPACGGQGSGYMSGGCLIAGQLMADFSDPTYVGLHAIAATGNTNTSPLTITTASGDTALTVSTIITSTTSLDKAANLQTGDTVTIPFTAPSGFTDPASGHACVSAPVEHLTEEMGYSISGSNITFTGHRFDHYVPNGGVMTIALNSCAATAWAQDTADNTGGGTNGGGPTFYNVIGATDAHHLLISAHLGGMRANGAFQVGGLSITTDGGTRSVFNVWPAAMVVDVSDPQYTPFTIYAPGPAYAHLATNTVPWGSGKNTAQGYWPADIYRLRREVCDTPMPDQGDIGSDCNYMEVRGGIKNTNDYRYTNDPTLIPYRGAPSVIRFQPYSNNNSAGSVSYFADGRMVPYYGWMVSTRRGCGGHLDDPQNCPDHFIWAEGASNGFVGDLAKSWRVSDANQTITHGTYTEVFNGNITGTNASFSGQVNPLLLQLKTIANLSCSVSTDGGRFNYIAGAAGTKDTVQVCAKDASNNYAWRTIY